jgi:hypothetical protein
VVTGSTEPDDTLSPVALELRVHGVHNTPPASMLGIDKPDLEQVAGDGVTGFYRARSGLLPYRHPKSGLAVEAYSWGTLTSGVGGFLGWVKRALWLLLLPFALANMAYWARLRVAERDESRRRPEAVSAIRAASLLLTVFFVVIAATVFVDLVGWQCFRAGTSQCAGLPGWMDWMRSWSTGQRLAVGSLGPLALVLIFVLLTNRSRARYEQVVDPLQVDLRTRPDRHRVNSSGVAMDTRPEAQVLLDPDLWDGAGRTATLRDAHVAAALATVAAFTAAHVAHVWLGGAGWQAAFVTVVVMALVVFAAAVGVVVGTVPGDLEQVGLGWHLGGWGRWLVRLAVVLVVVELILLVAAPESFDLYADYAGRNAWFVVLFVAITALHLCVFLGERLSGWRRAALPLLTAAILVGGVVLLYERVWHRSRASAAPDWGLVVVVICVVVAGFFLLALWHYSLAHDSRVHARDGVATAEESELARSAFAGAGASVLVAAASWTILLFASAAVIGLANVLNGSDPVTDLRTVPLRHAAGTPDAYGAGLVVPQVMLWAPLAQTVWLLLVGVAVGVCVWRFRPARAAILSSSYAGVPAPDVPAAQQARASAAFVHRAERVLDMVGFVTSPVALVLVVVSAQSDPPEQLVAGTVVDLALYVVLLAALGLVTLGAQVRTSDSVRRAVGVIWDLSTFWPRAAHPFSPPCYAERVVPEITRRVAWALEVSGDRAVVLSGHSQGSLIVTTVAARLPDLSRVRLITYGSQVRALYGRFFPAVFGPDVIGYETTTGPSLLNEAAPDLPTTLVVTPAPPAGTVRGRLDGGASWVNLFRRTDPLGFRVFSDHDSQADVPTLEVPTAEWGDSGPAVKGHSDYQHSPEYRTVLHDWTGEDLVGPPTSTTDVLPLPPP